MTEGTRKRPTVLTETQDMRDAPSATADPEESPSPGKRLPPPASNDVRCYRITSGSQPCPLLATAKVNPILAGTRTLIHKLSDRNANFWM